MNGEPACPPVLIRHNYTVRTFAGLTIHQLSKLFVVDTAFAKRRHHRRIRPAQEVVIQFDHLPVTTSTPARLVAKPFVRPRSFGSRRKSSCQSKEPNARCSG